MLGNSPVGSKPLAGGVTGIVASGAIGTITVSAPGAKATIALSTGTTKFAYSGASITYAISVAGTIIVKSWGAAGGSHVSGTSSNHIGGAGGYTTYGFTVAIGDTIKVDVGGGGGSNASQAAGWPDGGAGGQSDSSSQQNGAGGGGSTRVWLDVGSTGTFVLMCVAGAGGGVQSAFDGSDWGGVGGGSSGTAGAVGSGETAQGGFPGTQIAGGAGGQAFVSGRAGASLQGGSGGGALVSNPGGGGGGGFFGGGAGVGTDSGSKAGPGGGGSGYINTAHANYVATSGVTTAGTVNTGVPPNTSDPVYPTSPANVGAAVATTTGGPGFAVLSFSTGSPVFATPTVGNITVSAPAGAAAQLIPAHVSSALATISVSAPAPTVTHGDTVAASLANITVSAPNAIAGLPAVASGQIGNIAVSAVGPGTLSAGLVVSAAIGTISVTEAPGTTIQTSATIIQPLLDYSITVSETPTATVTGGASLAPNLATITVGNVTGFVPGATSGNIGTISVVAPAVSTRTTKAAPLSTISVTAPTTGLTIGQNLNVLIGTIAVDVVNAFVSGDGAFATSDLGPSITVTGPEAATSGGQLYTAPLADPIVVSAPGAAGFGASKVQLGGIGGVTTSLVIGVDAPSVTVAYGQHRVFALPAAIQVVIPTGIARQAAIVLVPVVNTPISVSPPGSSAGQAWTQDVGNISTITVSAPDVSAISFEIGHASSSGFGAITVEAPGIAAEGSAGRSAGIGTVTVSAPVPSVYTGTGIPASTSALLPVISVVSPEGWVADGMPGKLWFKRSEVSGNIPGVLASREIALNEVDGIIFFRDPGGAVTSSSYLALSQNGFAPSGGSAGDALLGNGTWGAAPISYTAPVRAALPKTAPGELAIFSDGSLGLVAATPALNEVLVQPFFVAKPMTISTIGVNVVLGASSMATVSICPWDPATGTLGVAIASGSIDCAASGAALATAYATIETGWYAATIELTGSSAPTLAASVSATRVDADFNLTPELAYVVAEIAA